MDVLWVLVINNKGTYHPFETLALKIESLDMTFFMEIPWRLVSYQYIIDDMINQFEEMNPDHKEDPLETMKLLPVKDQIVIIYKCMKSYNACSNAFKVVKSARK